MRFWKPWKARKFARYRTLSETSYAVPLVPDLSSHELRLLEGDRGVHTEMRRAQLRPVQARMQHIKVALLADVSLWMLREHDRCLHDLINHNLEYAQELGAHLSQFKLEVEALESTFLAQTQDCLQDPQFWWHQAPASVLYARNHYGCEEDTLYSVRQVLDIPFRHLRDGLSSKHLELVRRYRFPQVNENAFKPLLGEAPSPIAALLDEYDELLGPGRKLVSQIAALETLSRQEQSQMLWKNA